jgi:chromosome segregation ATPase
MLQMANSERYELKQRHDVTTSELNAKILKMRMGIHSLESDFKEKLEN